MKSLHSATNNVLSNSKNDRATALNRLKKRRKVWLEVHLWLGLILGFFLALLGVTGSILVFYEEIDKALNAELFVVEASPRREKPLSGLSLKLRRQQPP